jgi:hypothetical protein
MEDATRADQWDFLRNNPDLGKGVPLEIDFQDYYKGRENWHLDRYDRGAEQVRALNKSGDPTAAEVMDWTPRQEAMVTQLHREHGKPVLELRKQWDDAAVNAVLSGRRMDPGDVPSEVGEHILYRNADNRARQADLQGDMDAVYESLKLTDPAEAEAYRKMQRLFKKLREAGITPPTGRSDLLIPPPSSHPQVQMPPYGKQGMANVKLALDMFRSRRS